MKRIILPFISMLLPAALLFSACAPAKTVKKSETPESETAAVSTQPVTAPNVEVQEASLRGGEYAETPELRAIHFDYDSSSLKNEDMAILKSNAEYLKAHPEAEVEVAGHCDQRGTVQYNLALGQRRAKATRDYYMRLGVSGKSIATISYGKEKPLCTQSTEECWAKNRRAETLVRKAEASKGDASDPDQ